MVSSESQIIKNIDVRLIASGRARDADGRRGLSAGVNYTIYEIEYYDFAAPC
jgi:hypothetical protein